MAGHPDTGSEFWSTLERRVYLEWLAITLFTVVVTVLLNLYGEQTGISRLNYTFYDSILRVAPHPLVGDEIVIIAIDDHSLEQLGRWPWRRQVHAQLLDHLTHARRVGLDVVFGDPNPAFPDDDAQLAEAAARHGRVVLPTIIAQDASGNRQLQRPLPRLAGAAAGLGYINVYPDSDGTIRSLTLRQELGNGQHAEHFIVPMLDRGPGGAEDTGKPRLIPYAGPAGHFTFYSYIAVLRGDVPPERFRDRLVLVGAWGSGLGDTFPTPMTRQGETMSGVEVLANGLRALAHDNWIRTLPPPVSALLGCVPVLLSCLAFRRFSPRQSLLATLAILLAWCALAALLLVAGKLWLPVTASVIGVALAFPLWSWRSQEASLQHVDQELHNLQQTTGINLSGTRGFFTVLHDRSLPTRVRLLHQAIVRFREIQHKREETLRFLSHDMRAPQNAILALIELQRHEAAPHGGQDVLARIERRAKDTLELMEGFVQWERAQLAAIQRQAIELTGLLQEACDAYWELARRRKIAIIVSDVPEQAWVAGDQDLLGRVLRNLLDNALKYSPEHTEVRCSIAREGTYWNLRIEDEGRGIPASQIGRLFDPFQRVAADAPGNPSGTGLGLAFVRATVERHDGTVSVRSQEQKGSTFVVSLPALPDHSEAPEPP